MKKISELELFTFPVRKKGKNCETKNFPEKSGRTADKILFLLENFELVIKWLDEKDVTVFSTSIFDQSNGESANMHRPQVGFKVPIWLFLPKWLLTLLMTQWVDMEALGPFFLTRESVCIFFSRMVIDSPNLICASWSGVIMYCLEFVTRVSDDS